MKAHPITAILSFILLILVSILMSCSESSDNTADKQPANLELSSAETMKLPKLIDLGSDHCKSCKKMMPVLDSLRIAYQGKAEIIFIDVKKDRKSARKYGITMIPTQVFLDAEGNEVHRHVGFMSAESITDYFKTMDVEL
ncbi:MAG: thioredoxin family protein [candidate division Zixibacteria bacterium]|nr:thioredoxin family protein [candidate division Zixibacteria bacterium]